MLGFTQQGITPQLNSNISTQRPPSRGYPTRRKGYMCDCGTGVLVQREVTCSVLELGSKGADHADTSCPHVVRWMRSHPG